MPDTVLTEEKNIMLYSLGILGFPRLIANEMKKTFDKFINFMIYICCEENALEFGLCLLICRGLTSDN